MKVFVDDIRRAPDGWEVARTVTQAIRILSQFSVEEISLDHDIMCEFMQNQHSSRETFEPVAHYIAALPESHRPETVIVHTANPQGGDKITSILKGKVKNLVRDWSFAEDLRSFEIISAKEAAEFITESNAIENIEIPVEEALKGWLTKNSIRPEIKGHVSALNYVIKNYKKELNLDMILSVHRRLMKGLLWESECGQIRRDLVSVGGRRCPYPIELSPMLRDWLNKVNKFENPSEDDLWQSHLAFEYIHPFIDGNGRSGRLVWLWLRLKHGFPYKCIYNITKFEKYYPQFNSFVWERWVQS